MKVRVLRNPYYGADTYTIGKTYNAKKASDGRNYMVECNDGTWLYMYPNELQFICHGVAVCETSSGASGAK